MTRALPWILFALVVVALVLFGGRMVRDHFNGIDNLTNERNAIQRQADSLQSEVVRRDVLIEALNSDLAKRERERDSAQGSWKPVQQEQDAFVLHFDTAGIGAAIDSLNARPIGF